MNLFFYIDIELLDYQKSFLQDKRILTTFFCEVYPWTCFLFEISFALFYFVWKSPFVENFPMWNVESSIFSRRCIKYYFGYFLTV